MIKKLLLLVVGIMVGFTLVNVPQISSGLSDLLSPLSKMVGDFINNVGPHAAKAVEWLETSPLSGPLLGLGGTLFGGLVTRYILTREINKAQQVAQQWQKQAVNAENYALEMQGKVENQAERLNLLETISGERDFVTAKVDGVRKEMDMEMASLRNDINEAYAELKRLRESRPQVIVK